MTQLAAKYARIIIVEVTDRAFSTFDILGASWGAGLAHHMAVQAEHQGAQPRRVVLCDPAPPISFGGYPTSLSAAAQTIEAIQRETFQKQSDEKIEYDSLLEDEVGIVLHTRLVQLGLCESTLESVTSTVRSLRVFQHSARIGDEQMQRLTGVSVVLVLASEREAFWSFVCSSDPVGTSAALSAQVLRDVCADVAVELSIDGDHLTVCADCVSGRNDLFGCWLAM